MLLLSRLLTRSVVRACTPFASSASAHVAQRGAQREPRRPFLVACLTSHVEAACKCASAHRLEVRETCCSWTAPVWSL
eukprot:4530367-Pleurochrysis_carterae.AAC.1